MMEEVWFSRQRTSESSRRYRYILSGEREREEVRDVKAAVHFVRSLSLRHLQRAACHYGVYSVRGEKSDHLR